MGLRRWFALCLASVLLIIASLYVYAHHQLTSRLLSFGDRTFVHAAAIDKDLSHLSANAFVPNSQAVANADTYIDQHLDWETSDVRGDAGDESLVNLHRELDGALKDPQALSRLVSDPRLDQVATDWISGLHSFDHWNIFTNPRLQRLFQQVPTAGALTRVGVLAASPVPNYLKLYRLAQIHLLKLHRQRRTLDGLKDYRKVVELIHTSNTLLGNMIVVSMLNRERSLVEHWNVRGWTPVSEETALAYRRLSFAFLGMAALAFEGRLPDKWARALESRFGACAAAGELSSSYINLNQFLEPRWPFESDFRESFKRARAFYAQLYKSCRSEELNVLLMSPETASSSRYIAVVDAAKDVHDKDAYSSEPLSRLPFIRRLIGLGLLTISAPNHFGQYEALSKTASP